MGTKKDRQSFKPSAFFFFLYIRRKKVRDFGCPEPTMAVIILQIDAQRGAKKVKSLKEISTKPQDEFVQGWGLEPLSKCFNHLILLIFVL